MPPNEGVAARAIPPPQPIDGSKHSLFAPLSANQTLEMIGDNKEDCITLHQGLSNLQRELAEALGTIAGIQKGDQKMIAAITALQGGLANNDKLLEELRKDVERHDGRAKENRQNIEKLDVKFDQLLESEKHRDHKIDGLARDSVQMREAMQVLKVDLQKNFESDKLDRVDVAETNSRFIRNLDQIKQRVDDLQDKQRHLDAREDKFDFDMETTSTNIHTMEVQLRDACDQLRNLETTLDENIQQNKKLLDDHDRTKAKVDEVRCAARDLNHNREDLENRFKKALFDVQNTKVKLAGAQEMIQHHNNRLNKAQDTAMSASQGNMAVANQMLSLQRQLDDTTHLATSVKDGLKQTNTVVLPNILLDTEHSGVLKSRDIHPELRPPFSASGGRRSRTSRSSQSARTVRTPLGVSHADAFM